MSSNKPNTEGKSLLQVWFADEEYEQIRAAAAADHRSISSFVRARLIPAAERMVGKSADRERQTA